ncbi:BlaI/MecI/CopY family transcriptional regulator [Marinimicrobium sp. ABcell2]|uniref:BlaI/MecI/CopY family transcriptional regulator n=1 Tax=Marinimicrobium sp. ABcell2 TaxID=3069751 RepID=UPI0027B74873|nr:BlaI/MecI/CopY family transcriptional regulator [Marinimicrobium sp. ABcell2]MDQ2075888.1 BlaI/MecI/CopY family transcriptional regulator [Marinimicrobium sp. ABcell2]
MNNLQAPALGDLEVAVLEDIWRSGSSDTKAVHARVGSARAIALNTVQSTLERLYRKGLLQREKIRHAYQYSAAVSRQELIGRMVETTVQRIANPGSDELLKAYVDLTARGGPDQLDKLADLIAERRAKQN